MDAGFKSDTGRAVQLRNNHALGSVDDEGALRRHERNFAHVNFLFLGPALFAQLEGYVQRRAESLALALRLERAQLRLADFVVTEIEHGFFVVTFNRENFLKNSLQA